MIAIAVLLALLLIVSSTQLVMNLQANAARAERTAAAQELVQRASNLSSPTS